MPAWTNWTPSWTTCAAADPSEQASRRPPLRESEDAFSEGGVTGRSSRPNATRLAGGQESGDLRIVSPRRSHVLRRKLPAKPPAGGNPLMPPAAQEQKRRRHPRWMGGKRRRYPHWTGGKRRRRPHMSLPPRGGVEKKRPRFFSEGGPPKDLAPRTPYLGAVPAGTFAHPTPVPHPTQRSSPKALKQAKPVRIMRAASHTGSA